MSDETVVDTFVGEFEHKRPEKINNSDPNKLGYYPRKGVRLTIDKVLVTGKTGGAYAKITVSNDGGTFEAKLVLERAVFQVDGQTLVARDMELKPGLLLTETLTMTVGAQGQKEMKHALSFSDGNHGDWICDN